MKRRLGSALSVALLAAGLTACSTGSTDTSSTDDGATTSKVEDGAYPVTIEHAFGETTIEEEPKRVATVGWTDQDHVLALGVVPVGATELTWGGNDNGSSDWFDARLEEVGGEAPTRYSDTDGIPFDEIAESQPDLILATNSGITQKDYDKLSEIAEVVAYPEAPWVTSWRDSLEMVGDALGRPALADELLEESEQVIADAREEHPEVDGTSFVFTYFTPTDLSKVGIYGDQDPRVEIMEEFGLVTPDWVTEVVPDGQFYADVSAERAGTVESDLLLTYEETEGDTAKLAENRLLGRIPALASGQFFAEPDKELGIAVTNPTPLSIPVIADDFLPKVAAALGG
ncbi:iron-siderophore ABC transporter substrate-binding protein [Nocardioides sp. Y6]|uniref:Iron-siderophore ABC transporter substrate-binding protein n=1 Tax=Nocardioides malaquae TaxID=2773426 RepID=A0ABR9RW63_9ACTN|nr:iron-siderophore ABC transporter substrate-binding protein [Nocardioides malaquae]MBE7325797.1 iron-siderophore ABC transporter substrate-binding protein [Nocardioides malaquae]